MLLRVLTFALLLFGTVLHGTAWGQSNTDCPVYVIYFDGSYWVVQFQNCVTPGGPFIRRVTPKPPTCYCNGGNCLVTTATAALVPTPESGEVEAAGDEPTIEITDADYYGLYYQGSQPMLRKADGTGTKLLGKPGRYHRNVQIYRRNVDLETLEEKADGVPVTIVSLKPNKGDSEAQKQVLIVYQEIEPTKPVDFGFTRVRYDVTLPSGDVCDVMTLELSYEE